MGNARSPKSKVQSLKSAGRDAVRRRRKRIEAEHPTSNPEPRTSNLEKEDKAAQNHPVGKAEWSGKATQSHLQATFKPTAWEGIATHMRPTCDPKATLKPPTCDLKATPKPPQGYPKARHRPGTGRPQPRRLHSSQFRRRLEKTGELGLS